jgi:hypothetical protein
MEGGIASAQNAKKEKPAKKYRILISEEQVLGQKTNLELRSA